ncbi:MAG TPA: DUF3857 domain-containing protein [Terracidiphilus sp.]|nr:DUF3857 domain-containing protein [Terracidiphilus sp.]
MTADPQAPGADAVYLNLSEVDDNLDLTKNFHARIKVLTEKGKDAATVEIPYVQTGSVSPYIKIEARTIHPDGTVIPLQGEPADLLVEKVGETQFRRKVITMPGVVVGSILEYSYHRKSYFSFPDWSIQRKYLVHKAHYTFRPGLGEADLLWWTVLPPGVTLQRGKDATGTFTLDMTDVPPSPDEEWMPPIASVLYRVVIYRGHGKSVNDFWVPVVKYWSQYVDEFADPSRTIREAVNGLVAPDDSDEVKAKKLYQAVQALDNTDFTRAKDQAERKKLKEKAIKSAQDVWKQKSGNREEIALLYLAMLRAAGLKAYAMRVVDRDQGLFAAGYFSFDQLDDTVVLVTLNGKEVVTDPGEKMCPFMGVSWKHSLATGIRQEDKGGDVATTPMQLYGGNKLVREGQITVDAQGDAKGELTFTMTGQDALRWREAAVLNDLTEVKKEFNDWVGAMVPQGMEASLEQFTGLDNEDVPLKATIAVHGMLGTPLGKRLMLPGEFFDTRGHRPFVGREKRQEPVDMHYGQEISSHVVYELPAGMSVEGAPKDEKIAWPGHAVMIARTSVGAGEVTLTRTMARAFTFVKAEEYQNLRSFYQQVAATDRAEIVVKAGQQAAGQTAAGRQ